MKPRFQADADLDRHIVAAVKRREPMVDFQSAQEAGLTGMSDPAVLAFAASEGRVLVSHDRKTMPAHFSDFVQRSTSPGLLIISQHLTVSAAAEELLLKYPSPESWMRKHYIAMINKMLEKGGPRWQLVAGDAGLHLTPTANTTVIAELE